MPSWRPRIERRKDHAFALKLPREERKLLRRLPAELRELLDADDPALERLFPPAYTDDADRQAEYRSLTHDDLRRHKLSSLEVMEATVDGDRLDEDQLCAWLGALNDLRLVLGTRLGVTEDLYDGNLPEDDPRGPGLALYSYLGALQDEAVEALAAGLPDEGTNP